MLFFRKTGKSVCYSSGKQADLERQMLDPESIYAGKGSAL